MNDLRIIYEDKYLLIIDKKAGITVNTADTTKNEPTIQEYVEQYLNFIKIGESDFYKRAGIVHRIDKETSGILIIAKTEESFLNLQLQFKNREVEKSYFALTHGVVTPTEGNISVPVGRLPWNRKRFGVLAGGKEAVTDYRVVSNYKMQKNNKTLEQLSFLELNPKTGRTHQIRVHLKYINHPIFADPLYAGRKTSRDDRKILPRVFLHARKISFLHPNSGERVEFESELASELKDFLNQLIKD